VSALTYHYSGSVLVSVQELNLYVFKILIERQIYNGRMCFLRIGRQRSLE
jgi:hypothetical protein